MGSRDLRERPLRERREELEHVLENDQVLLFPARRLETDGLAAWAQVVERGYEGLVGKDESSPYRERPDALVAQGEGAEVPRGRTWLGSKGDEVIIHVTPRKQRERLAE
jgi:hypothetical protein